MTVRCENNPTGALKLRETTQGRTDFSGTHSPRLWLRPCWRRCDCSPQDGGQVCWGQARASPPSLLKQETALQTTGDSLASGQAHEGGRGPLSVGDWGAQCLYREGHRRQTHTRGKQATWWGCQCAWGAWSTQPLLLRAVGPGSQGELELRWLERLSGSLAKSDAITPTLLTGSAASRNSRTASLSCIGSWERLFPALWDAELLSL